MPANSVKINDKIEYIVPDSWMPTLIAYLEKVHEETGDKSRFNLQVYEEIDHDGFIDERPVEAY